MRWKSLGGETNFHGGSYETFTLAAGVAAATPRTNVIATMDIFAAKQMATVDQRNIRQESNSLKT